MPVSSKRVPGLLDLELLVAGSWLPLPDWARLLVSLGYEAAKRPQAKLLAAVSLPTGKFAALFVALGAVAAHFEDELVDPAGYFEELCAMPRGTPVVVRDHLVNGKPAAVPGKIIGAEVRHIPTLGRRERYLHVELKRGGGRLLNAEQSTRVQVRDSAPGQSRAYAERDSLVSALVDKPWLYTEHSSKRLALVGARGALFGQVESARVRPAHEQDTPGLEGSLAELVRMTGCVPRGSGTRCRIVSSATSPKASSAEDLVIFDGPSAFLAHNRTWRASNWIVLLDRCDAHFEEATQLTNSLYLARQDVRVGLDIASAELPMESVVFERRP